MVEHPGPNQVGFGADDVDDALVAGSRVQVRTRFDGTWARGFVVSETVAHEGGPPRYRLRRISDGAVLPVLFEDADVSGDL